MQSSHIHERRTHRTVMAMVLAALAVFESARAAGADTAGAAPTPLVTLVSPRPPTDQELAGDSVYEFVVHHGTVHTVTTGVVGGLARWRGGRSESICPVTVGLDPGYNAFVTARLREVAAAVGAPLSADPSCKSNVKIVFTTQPEPVMADILKAAAQLRHTKYPHQTEKQLAVSAGHAVQGWYMTANSHDYNADVGMVGPIDFQPAWPLAIQTGINTSGDADGGIVGAIWVVDTAKVAGYTIGSIADYLVTLTLSVVQSPDHCDPLPSILDLMASNCGSHGSVAVTAGDLAFLKALYYHNTGLGPSLSRDDIRLNMMQQFRGTLPP